MGVHYTQAAEVKQIATELIRKHHRHLMGVRVDTLFIDRTPSRNSKEVWGTARKVTSLAAFLASEGNGEETEPFFVIVISEPVWRRLSLERKTALVDHELCHLWVEEKDDGSNSLTICSHDLEEFAQVVARHGLWRDEVTQFATVTSQALQASLYEVEVETDEMSQNRMSEAA